MKQVLAKAQIEANMTSRFGAIFTLGEKRPAHFISSGVPEIDILTGGGLPRGGITEIVGSASSGRTGLLLSALAYATANSETCVLVDTSDSFDPASAGIAQVDFKRLLWVRCGNSVERAFKATDLLLQSGGFGLVALNLADMAAEYARRIISSWWFRFRRAIESTPTALTVITPVPCVRSCASMILEMKSDGVIWPGTGPLTLETTEMKRGDESSKMHQLSLVSTSQSNRYQSFLTHSYLLRAINVRVKLAKPTVWTQSSVRFQHVS